MNGHSRLWRLAIPVVLGLCAFAAYASSATNKAGDQPLSETQKIESLISIVANLKDATFVRNGKEYDCGAAADHMRTKWKRQQDEIKTAADFIRVVGSKSSQSGQPYVIRFKDGKESGSAEFLSAKLAELEKSADAKQRNAE